jgi:hypothetical protein
VGAGDQFRLFVANSYSGSFASLTLPPLGVGLTWTNKLLVDGSIQVIGPPRFTAVAIVGTNLVISGSGGTTNAAYTVLTARQRHDAPLAAARSDSPDGEFALRLPTILPLPEGEGRGEGNAPAHRIVTA